MAKAIWKNTVLAQSEKFEVIEGNLYFPPESVNRAYLRDSATDYECPWKGHADYYDVVVSGMTLKDAAWYYPEPKPAARQIKGHVAFDRAKGIKVEQ
jgi:uncharacterized protein (DUF427 family)